MSETSSRPPGAADRRLWADREQPHRSPGASQRRHRLALPAQGSTRRRSSPPCSEPTRTARGGCARPTRTRASAAAIAPAQRSWRPHSRPAAARRRVIDFMPRPGADGAIELVRLVRGDQGAVDFETTIRFRFDYGQQLPWVRANPVGLSAIAGPDAVRLVSSVPLTNRDFATRANFRVRAGETVSFNLIWHASHQPPPDCRAPEPLLVQTESRVEGLDRPRQLRRPSPRDGRTLVDHAEAPHLRADRRDRGGADHLAAGADRRPAQLGLSLLLGARRDAVALRLPDVGLSTPRPRPGGAG